jgi:crotonobetainyl-CoA:carnitine CoA-transferase CaiB-like acyl-CoA transferase
VAGGPPFLNGTKDAGYFLAVNRGKRSITLDITKPAGQAIAKRLAQDCDIVIENFKVGALKRYGLGAASLRALKPSLIYCSVTGFGQDGPRAEQAAYDFMIQAMCGLMSITGEADGAPQKVGVPIIDLMTGMYAATAILAAVARRAETGEGETIDLAMLDVGTAVLSNQAMNHLVGGRVPHRAGNRHPNIQPQDVFPASDGEIVLAVGNDGQFAKLCEAIDLPELAADPRFIRNADRVRHNGELTPLLAERFSDFTRAELTARLDAAGVPCGPINTVPDVFADPQVLHRGLLRHLPHPAGEVPMVRSPIRMDGMREDGVPPLLGADTAAVLNAIGIGATEQAALAAEGII